MSKDNSQLISSQKSIMTVDGEKIGMQQNIWQEGDKIRIDHVFLPGRKTISHFFPAEDEKEVLEKAAEYFGFMRGALESLKNAVDGYIYMKAGINRKTRAMERELMVAGLPLYITDCEHNAYKEREGRTLEDGPFILVQNDRLHFRQAIQAGKVPSLKLDKLERHMMQLHTATQAVRDCTDPYLNSHLSSEESEGHSPQQRIISGLDSVCDGIGHWIEEVWEKLAKFPSSCPEEEMERLIKCMEHLPEGFAALEDALPVDAKLTEELRGIIFGHEGQPGLQEIAQNIIGIFKNRELREAAIEEGETPPRNDQWSKGR